MKPRTVLVAFAVVAMAGTCVRLGFWQVSRLHEKQRLNASLRAALAAPPVELGGRPAPLDSVLGRRVSARGRFDEARQVLLADRPYEGSPGVEVVTPLLLPGGSALLVDRGWLYAGDAATAAPGDYPEPGERTVTGLAQALPRDGGGAPFRRLPAGARAVWSARLLDRDSLAARFPYPLAPYVVRELPGPGVPARPRRLPPRPYDEFMHVSYAIQWFLFATILLGGSLAVSLGRRRKPRPGASPVDPELYRKG